MLADVNITMQVDFQHLRDYIYSIKLDLPYTNEEIVNELRIENWEEDIAGYGQSSFPTRYRLRQVTQPKLLEIERYVEHGDFKQRIIDELWKTPFTGHWGVSAEKMMKITHLYGGFTKDLPGFNIRIHTDDRMHVVQGMIYFINDNDPKQSTCFYSDKNAKDPLPMTTGHGLGYFAANTNDGWHTGQNASDVDRYSMIFGIRLDL